MRIVLFVSALICLASLQGHASEVRGSGVQTRGMPGQNAELRGKPFTLTGQSVITRVEGDGRGFWIQDESSRAVLLTCDRNGDGEGKLIPKGTYRVFPHLQPQQKSASVTIIFRPAGAAPPVTATPPVRKSPAPDPVVGTWTVKKTSLTFLPGGRITPDNGGTYTWTRRGEYRPNHPAYTVRFNKGKRTSVITLYLSRDGTTLYEVHAGASYLWGKRITR